MHEASGLNKEIQERSKDAALVLMNMPPFPLEHNLGCFSFLIFFYYII